MQENRYVYETGTSGDGFASRTPDSFALFDRTLDPSRETLLPQLEECAHNLLVHSKPVDESGKVRIALIQERQKQCSVPRNGGRVSLRAVTSANQQFGRVTETTVCRSAQWPSVSAESTVS